MIWYKNSKIIAFFLCILLSFGLFSCNSTKQENKTPDEEIQNELDELEETDEPVFVENQETEEVVVAEAEVIDSDTDLVVQEPVTQETEPAPKQYTKEQQLFIDMKTTKDFLEIGDDLDYKITVNDETKEVILLFEHTNGNEDWHNNYLFFAWPLKLDGHVIWTSYGYAKMYKSANDVPFNEFYRLTEEHPDYKVVIRGWSLGSAMAKIAARHFSYRAPKGKLIDELTTYGDVKVWYNLFYSVKKYCKNIREYVNVNDYITWCLPFCRRDVKNKVGAKFNFKDVKRADYLHEHYEEFDYSKWSYE